MKVKYLRGAALDALTDPNAAVWKGLRPEVLPLSGTPSGLQPTAAVRAEFPDNKIGAVKTVSISAAHNGNEIAFRLEWADDSLNTGAESDTTFSDGAAILLPSSAGAPLMTMGAPGQPVNAWYWRADEKGRGRHVTAEGLGTSDTADLNLVKAQGIHSNGVWRVVIARALSVKSRAPVAQLKPGSKTRLSVAIWEGGSRERAGIKSFALGQHEGWHELVLDPQA